MINNNKKNNKKDNNKKNNKKKNKKNIMMTMKTMKNMMTIIDFF